MSTPEEIERNRQIGFGSYRLDAGNARLWRGGRELKITPKAFAVLCHLLARQGQLVSKEELFAAVWPKTAVSDAALTSCIQELRKVLRDDPRRPRYVETVHRRGFRFIARCTHLPEPGDQSALSLRRAVNAPPICVGREAELRELDQCFATALAGTRQVVLLGGEAGIGKTTLVDWKSWEL
jgi:DNA-binding winged helix-turn-helix (wHTH) protein